MKTMVGLGNNAHIFARPERRESWRALFEDVLGSQVATVSHHGMHEPMLVVRFPDGGAISIEFTADAEDGDEPRFATWLELRTPDPNAVMEAVNKAGIQEVKHPGHPFYFMAPGGQVFTVVKTGDR